MPTNGQRIDPASIRFYANGHEYRIGQRVMTDRGPATITAFDPESYCDIGVTLDGSEEELYTVAQNAAPIDD
ncbi:MAG TPA: hypothetical protein VNM70_19455 [Burkholderiales bacterium]|nr:hypothetical protein [Burkholderiales bacterium]